MFRAHWVGGVDGLLGAMVLIVLTGPARWWLFGALALVDVTAWLFVGLPYEPGLSAAIWLGVAFLNTGFGLYGMATASVLVGRLEATGELLADAAAERERSAAARQLQSSIADRLDLLRADTARALSARTLEGAQVALGVIGRVAREAAASARGIASAPRALEPSGPGPVELSGRSASRVVVVVVVLFGVQFLDNTLVSAVAAGTATGWAVLASVLIAPVMVVAQLRHSMAAPGQRPAGWRWTLLVQVALCLVLYPVFGAGSGVFLAFVGASVLLLARSILRWAVFAATVLAVPVMALAGPAHLAPASAVSWSVYASATMAYTSLLLFSLSRLPATAALLERACARLASVRAARERTRIAQDAHDALGLSLSTIALKSDLAGALLGSDPDRSRREMVQVLRLAQTASADAASIVTGDLRITLAAELNAAAEALAAAGISIRVEQEPPGLPSALDAVFGTVLREAVTNVLRHSDARTCIIRVRCERGAASVTVFNDRPHLLVSGFHTEGTGLGNIRSRVARLAGAVDIRREGDLFEVSATVPLPGNVIAAGTE